MPNLSMTFKPPANADDKKRIKYLETYVTQLTEKLTYCLGHIDADNISSDVGLLQNDNTGSNTYDYQLNTINSNISTLSSNIGTVASAVSALESNVTEQELVYSGELPVTNTSAWALILIQGTASIGSASYGFQSLVPLAYLRADEENTFTSDCNTASGIKSISYTLGADDDGHETVNAANADMTITAVKAYGIIKNA